MEEKYILNLGKKEALCIMVRNHFYSGSWDTMIKEIKKGSFKEFVSLKTVQLLKGYEESNKVNLSSLASKNMKTANCLFRERHRRIKHCCRKD